MKLSRLIAYFFIISALPLQAQITINDTDMAIAGKVYFMSKCYDYSNFKVSETGANYTWDYSNIKGANQEKDTVKAITSSPQAYQFIFNSYLDPKPTTCIQDLFLHHLDSLDQFKPSKIFNYYKTTPQNFSFVGFGVNISNTDVPVKYDTADIIYRFPLTFGSTDSSTSYFVTPTLVSQFFIYSSHQKRKNKVDGWGTLKTPYGSFSVLRVKSEITTVDSFYNKSTGKKYQIQQPTRYEYKWLGKKTGVPLLLINTELQDTLEVITGISYPDSLRKNSITENHQKPISVKIYPNPFSQSTSIEYNVDQYKFVSVELIDLNGKIIQTLQSGFQNPGNYSLPLNIFSNCSSIYFLRFRMNDQIRFEKLIFAK